MMALQLAFIAGAALGGGIGILLGQHLAWWFLFPAYRRQWQPRRRGRRGRWP